MSPAPEVEVVFEPQPQGGFTVYSPDLPGMITQGDTMADAEANATEAIALYVESMQERGKPLPSGVVRRTFPLPGERPPATRGFRRPSHQGAGTQRLASRAHQGQSLGDGAPHFEPTLVVPRHKELRPGTLNQILKQAQISREEFLRLRK